MACEYKMQVRGENMLIMYEILKQLRLQSLKKNKVVKLIFCFSLTFLNSSH